MANLTSQLTVKLLDLVSAPAREAAKALRGIGSAVDATNRKGAGGLRGVTKEVKKTAKEVGRHARGTSGASMPAGLFLGWGSRIVYDFEKTSNAMKSVVVGMTDEQKKAVQDLAKTLDKEFPHSLDQIMGAAFELGRAGYDFEQIMGGLRETLVLALAGDIDLPRAADIATNIQTAMRMMGETAEETEAALLRIVDVIGYVASRSNTDVALMGESMKYVAPLAAAAGVGLDELGGMFIVLARNGIRGAEAGVAVRSALVRMVKPSLDARQAMAELDLSFEQFVNNWRQLDLGELRSGLRNVGIDIDPIMGDLKASIDGMTLAENRGEIYETLLAKIIEGLGIDKVQDKRKVAKSLSRFISSLAEDVDIVAMFHELREKDATIGHITRILDQRQGARLQALLADDLPEAVGEVSTKSEGAGRRMADIRMEGIVRVVAEFTAAITKLFIAIAESGVMDSASKAITAVTDALNWLSEASPRLLEFATYGLLLIAILGPLGILLGGVASALAALSAVALGFLTVTGLRAAAGSAAAGAGATAGGAAAGGAAVGGAAAAAKGGFWRRLLRFGGIAGTAWTGLEVLKFIDPKGNLWGLTEGIDNWFKENFGFDPSNLGGDGPTEAERAARLAEIKRRMDAVEAGIHTEAHRDLLLGKGSPDEAGAAGGEFMNGYEDAIRRGFVDLNALVDAEMSKLKAKMSTTAGITITPRVDGATLRGVHADTGVE